MGEEHQRIQVEGLIQQIRHFGLAFLVCNTLFVLAVAAIGGTVIFCVATSMSRNQLHRGQYHARSGQLEP